MPPRMAAPSEQVAAEEAGLEAATEPRAQEDGAAEAETAQPHTWAEWKPMRRKGGRGGGWKAKKRLPDWGGAQAALATTVQVEEVIEEDGDGAEDIEISAAAAALAVSPEDATPAGDACSRATSGGRRSGRRCRR